jgi:hypothetical protein
MVVPLPARARGDQGKEHMTMTNFRNVLLLSLGFALTGSALAQNHITVGVTPGQTTTGSGSIGVTVGGHGTVPVNVPAGTGSLGIATATANALTAQGFTVTQNGTDVTITAGPGGAPLMHGGGIGSTDGGVTGVKCKVQKAPGGGGGPGGGPGANAQRNVGGQVRQANPNGQAQSTGSLQVDVEVIKVVNGVPTLLWVQVVVPVFAGDDGQAINDRARQMMQQQGLIVNDLTLPPAVAPITPIPPAAFGIDRTVDGGKVQGVQVEATGGAKDVFDATEAGAARTPDTGAAEYDRSIDENGQDTGDFAVFQGLPILGQGGVIEAFTAPNQFGIFALQFGPGGLLQAPNVPLPFGPGFYMPLDPFGAQLHATITDPLGQMQMPLPIPPMPQLVGLELQTAALTLDPTGQTLFDGVKRTNALTIRVGQ